MAFDKQYHKLGTTVEYPVEFYSHRGLVAAIVGHQNTNTNRTVLIRFLRTSEFGTMHQMHAYLLYGVN